MTAQEQFMAEKGFLRASEAARRIRTAPQSVYRLAEAGKVRVERAGRAWYISASDLAELYPAFRDEIMKGVGDEAAPGERGREGP